MTVDFPKTSGYIIDCEVKSSSYNPQLLREAGQGELQNPGRLELVGIHIVLLKDTSAGRMFERGNHSYSMQPLNISGSHFK